MARRQTTPRTTTTTADRIEDLITALNTLEGIDFVEDAWVEKAPQNYGVVELTGEAANDYADGRKVAQLLQLTITIYVAGGSHHWITAVQGILDAQKVRYTMPQRQYLDDIQKVMWVWNARIRMPVIYTPEGQGNGQT